MLDDKLFFIQCFYDYWALISSFFNAARAARTIEITGAWRLPIILSQLQVKTRSMDNYEFSNMMITLYRNNPDEQTSTRQWTAVVQTIVFTLLKSFIKRFDQR